MPLLINSNHMRSGHSEKDATGGKVVVITGASSGIGRATAQLFADEGFRVFGASRRKCPNPSGVVTLESDVRSDPSVERCVAEVLARAGHVDVLVNNAGMMHMGIAEETIMEDARAVFDTNFFSLVRMTNAVLPSMRARRQGRIINVGSLAAWVRESGEAFYSASKHAMAGYTEALRHELWPLGIHVSLVEPAAFKTGVLQAASSMEGTIRDYDISRQAARDTMQEVLKNGGEPRNVARVILKIARARSPRLRYTAGIEAHWLPYLKVLLPQRLIDSALRRGFCLRQDEAKSKT